MSTTPTFHEMPCESGETEQAAGVLATVGATAAKVGKRIRFLMLRFIS